VQEKNSREKLRLVAIYGHFFLMSKKAISMTRLAAAASSPKEIASKNRKDGAARRQQVNTSS